jgi:hypothetical protein
LVPIEILYGIGAGGGAVSATDTPVIDLGHQPFFVFISCVDRADLGAGRVIAMHTRSGKKPRFEMRVFPFDIGDQFNPVDRSAVGGLFGSNERNIIFRMAGHHTRLASGTFVQINDHSPTRHS